jgi:extradiol dioxygenase family protein
MTLSPFHLSVPGVNLADTRRFYGQLLGCTEGRSAECRIDWNFFGHHLVTHVEPGDASHKTTDVDSFGVMTPCRHFGVVLSHDDWERLADRLRAAGADFHTEPQTIFPGTVKEQSVMLIRDGSGNIVEFKASRHGLWQQKL